MGHAHVPVEQVGIEQEPVSSVEVDGRAATRLPMAGLHGRGAAERHAEQPDPRKVEATAKRGRASARLQIVQHVEETAAILEPDPRAQAGAQAFVPVPASRFPLGGQGLPALGFVCCRG